MDKRIFVPFILIMICTLLFSGSCSNQNEKNSIESQIVDSLIKVQAINDRTIIVRFGYDAVTAIKTAHGIVLIDAGISTKLTDKYRRIIENNLHQNDFAYVINTHFHHDHMAGNAIFSNAKIAGHDNCKNEVSERWTNPEKSVSALSRIVEDYARQLDQSVPNSAEWNEIFTQEMRYKSALWDVKQHVPVVLPNITFADSMKIDLGDTTVEMLYFGRFHSDSDILIYIPEFHILFTGDLFSKYGRPDKSNTLISDEIRWKQALYWIKKRTGNNITIITGHGQILSAYDLGLFTKKLSEEFSN